MGNVFDGGGDRVMGCEQGVYNDAEVFHLKVSLVKGFKGASVIKVVVKWDGKMGICDGSDQCGVFGGRWE